MFGFDTKINHHFFFKVTLHCLLVAIKNRIKYSTKKFSPFQHMKHKQYMILFHLVRVTNIFN